VGGNENLENKGLFLSKIGERRIKIDSLTSNFPQDIQLYQIEKKYILALLNAPKNEIQLYDFEKNQLIEKKSLDENFFGQISDFYIHTLDSIFISSLTKQSAWLINGDNQILQTFKLNKALGSSLPIGNENIVFNEGKLIISTQIAIFDSKGIEDAPLVFIFEVNNDLINAPTYNYLVYPNIYQKSFSPELGLYYNSFDFSNNKFYHGFSASDWVYSLDVKNNKLDSIEIKPEFNFQIKNSTPSDLENFNTRQYYYYSNYNYGFILVDPTKRILYRMFYFPKKDLEKNSQLDYEDLKPKCILIFDLESGELRGQFNLTDKNNEGLMFILNKKIYINQIQDNEDEIVFDIFDTV
jgi:hypothetical protein